MHSFPEKHWHLRHLCSYRQCLVGTIDLFAACFQTEPHAMSALNEMNCNEWIPARNQRTSEKKSVDRVPEIVSFTNYEQSLSYKIHHVPWSSCPFDIQAHPSKWIWRVLRETSRWDGSTAIGWTCCYIVTSGDRYFKLLVLLFFAWWKLTLLKGFLFCLGLRRLECACRVCGSFTTADTRHSVINSFTKTTKSFVRNPTLWFQTNYTTKSNIIQSIRKIRL